MTPVPMTGRRNSMDGFAVVMMICLTFSWGMNGVAIKISNSGYSPIFLALVRSFIGGMLVFLWCLARGIPLFRRDGSLLPGMLLGSLFATEFLMIFIGLDYTSVARSTLLVNTMPFWTLLAGHLLLGERISYRSFCGVLLAFAGLLVIFFDKLNVPGPDAFIGDLLSLGAGVAWAATIIVIRKTRLSVVSAEKLLLYQLGASVVFSLVLLPFSGPGIRDANTIATAALIFQSVYIVAVTYLLWFWLVQRYPASGLAGFTFFTPLFGVLLGGIVLGEPLGMTIFIALALIIAGLTLVNRQPRRTVPMD